MPKRLTVAERISLVRLSSVHFNKVTKIQRAWKTLYNSCPPSRKTIELINKKFDETGSVLDLSRSGRPITSRTEDKIDQVRSAISSDPTKSLQNIANELGVSKASVYRIKKSTDTSKSRRLQIKKLQEKLTSLQRKNDELEGKTFKKSKSPSTLLMSSNDLMLPHCTYTSEPRIEFVSIDEEGNHTYYQPHIPNGPPTQTTIVITSMEPKNYEFSEDGHQSLTIDESEIVLQSTDTDCELINISDDTNI